MPPLSSEVAQPQTLGEMAKGFCVMRLPINGAVWHQARAKKRAQKQAAGDGMLGIVLILAAFYVVWCL